VLYKLPSSSYLLPRQSQGGAPPREVVTDSFRFALRMPNGEFIEDPRRERPSRDNVVVDGSYVVFVEVSQGVDLPGGAIYEAEQAQRVARRLGVLVESREIDNLRIYESLHRVLSVVYVTGEFPDGNVLFSSDCPIETRAGSCRGFISKKNPHVEVFVSYPRQMPLGMVDISHVVMDAIDRWEIRARNLAP
jgi:hypothetical protein